jgi:hypothetical protein
VQGYKNIVGEILEVDPNDLTDEDIQGGHLVFLGQEPDTDDPDGADLVRLCWVVEVDSKNNDPMPMALMEKNEFVKNMLIPMESPKRMTVHYINIAGEKVNTAVNSENDPELLKDMKEDGFLYKFDN